MGMSAIKTKRIAPGMYEVHTDEGIFDVSLDEQTEPDPYGYSNATRWLVYWPGRDRADASTPTLREAKKMIEEVLKEDTL